MSSRRFVSLGVAAAILAAALPAAAQSGPDARLRASIDRALDAPAPPAALRTASPKVRKSQSAGTSNGGSGGGSKVLLALLGTAISVGATYLIVKEMQKIPEPPPPAFR